MQIKLDRARSMTYSTQELIAILDRELKANWKGKRVVLSSADRINDPVVTKLLDMNQVSKVFAYQDFRSQIHHYQKQHRISGVIWRDCTFEGKTVRYPEIHNQLIPLEEDKAVLMIAKSSVIDFWLEVTSQMQFWLANVPGRTESLNVINKGLLERQDRQETPHSPISQEYAAKLINQAEWAEVDATRTEVYLGLCWGNPLEYRYQWAKPKSGCDRIIASQTVPSSIKI
jgi:hypothetical protein